MSQKNRNDEHEDSKDVSSKYYKRGRPRKYPDSGEKVSSYHLLDEIRNQNIAVGNDAIVPPGFEPIMIGNKRSERDQVNGSNDVKVGKVVPASIDEEFEGGFWVSVRDAKSDSIFKGQIFNSKTPHVVNQSTHSQKKGKEVLNSPKPSFLQRGKSISKDANQDSVFGSAAKPSPALLMAGTSQGRGTNLGRKLSMEGNQVALPPTHQTGKSLLPLQSARVLRYLSSEIVVDETVTEITKNPMMAFDFGNLVNDVVKKIRSCSDCLSHVTDDSDQLPKQQ